MADKKFILQGLTSDTHTVAIRHLFDLPSIQQVILSVAFINEGGVELIEEKLRPVANRTTIFAGIRNDITSRQGLERLLALGVSLYIVDTGARSTIFHPKLYLVKNRENARLVIGSANLTQGGLNNNIEAGLALELNLTVPADNELVTKITNDLLQLPGQYPENISLITRREELLSLQDSGRLLDESESLPPRPVVSASNTSNDPVPRIRLAVVPIRRAVQRAQIRPNRVRTIAQTPNNQEERGGAETAVNLSLVWESKPLTERDLTIPQREGTHPTGSINLDKGLMEEGVDHRHYFRDVVFARLPWTPSSPTVEETEAEFELVVKGISYGNFRLRIAHTTSTDSPAYLQRNAMTRLSWGVAREYIARPDLIGRTLSLYRNETDPNKFVLEID